MTVPARSPEDDALDRLRTFIDTDGLVVPTEDAKDALATVREALERHREESEENFQAFMDERDKAVAAEAEVARLKAVIRDEEMEARYAARAEAEVRRLQDGLRETKAALDRERAGGSPLTREQYLALRARVRDLLSASPSDGGGA